MEITYDFPVWMGVSWAMILLLTTFMIRMQTRWRRFDDRLGNLARYHWLPISTDDCNLQLAIGIDPDCPPVDITEEQRIAIRDHIVEELIYRARPDHYGTVAKVIYDSNRDVT